METHSSIFIWEIPWTEDPGRLQSMGMQRIGHDRVTVKENEKAGLKLLYDSGNSSRVSKTG